MTLRRIILLGTPLALRILFSLAQVVGIVEKSPKQLARLAQPQDGAGDHRAEEPVHKAQAHGAERRLLERPVDDEELQ